jgi:SAM-dependent methyltransferase
MSAVPVPNSLDQERLRVEIQREYREVAAHPDKGYHFHTGRKLAGITGYTEDLLAGVPEEALACFAGTGNPFAIGPLGPGERVVDLGCGAGMDSFIAARQVGVSGSVIGLDMTEEMLSRAEAARVKAGLPQIRFQKGYLEDIPVADGQVDVVISNGVINLCPDKLRAFREIHRILRSGGRLQVGDIMVHKPLGEKAKQNIDLWTG